MNRRSLILGSLGLIAAPAIVRAESLMKIVVPRPRLITLEEYRAPMYAVAKIYEDLMLFGSTAWQETPMGLRHVPIEDWQA